MDIIREKMRNIGINILLVCILLMSMIYGCVEKEEQENGQEKKKIPTCTLLAAPTKGIAPLMVTFSLTAADIDGNISFWELDVNNDGTIDYNGTGHPPSTQEHTYADPGTYTAKLTVIDDHGSVGKDTFVITVTKKFSPIPP